MLTQVTVQPELRIRRVPAPADLVALLKPVTWFPPMWAFGCGVVATGAALDGRAAAVALGICVAGPLVCGASQATNDWHDRAVDAVNEPGRPIPSGRVSPAWALGLAVAWSGLALAAAAPLGSWVVGAAALGLLLGWAYSAPPLRLKRDGWLGALAVGVSYEGLAWLTGSAVATGGAAPGRHALVLALLYSIGAAGILALNDFKSMRGDRLAGIRSLPVRLGASGAAVLLCAVMLGAQIAATSAVFAWGARGWALATVPLLVAEVPLMLRFVADPVRRALWLSAVGVPLFVLGMLGSALGVRSLVGGGA